MESAQVIDILSVSANNAVSYKFESSEGSLTFAYVGTWMSAIAKDIESILALPPDWDGEYTQPVSLVTIGFLLDLLGEIMNDTIQSPRVFPDATGGLLAEWQNASELLQIEVNQPETQISVRHTSNNEQQEFLLNSDYSNSEKLKAWLSVFKADNA